MSWTTPPSRVVKFSIMLAVGCVAILACSLIVFYIGAYVNTSRTAAGLRAINRDRALRIEAHSQGRSSTQQVSFVRADDHSSGAVDRRRVGKVRGTILGEDKKPLAKAEIFFVSCDGLLQQLIGGELTAQSYFGGATYPHKLVESSAEGTYEIELEEGRHNLYAYCEGYAPASLAMIMVEAGRVNARNDLQLNRAATLAGFIHGAHGEAVPGAVITAIPTGWGPRHHTASSDETGRFRLVDLPSGAMLIEAHHPHHGSVVKENVDCSRISEIRMGFQAPGSVEFTLVEAGTEKPVPRCAATLIPHDERDAWRLNRRWSLESKSGIYRLGDITPNAYSLTISTPGYARLTSDIVLKASDLIAGLKFELLKGSKIGGRVMTLGLGTPIPETRISLHDWRRPPQEGSLFREFHAPPSAVTITKADGGFIFEDVPIGRYWLRAEHRSFPPVVETDVRVEGVRDTTREILLPHGGTVFGRTPWPFTDVIASTDAGTVRMTFSDQAGEFEIFGLPSGRCLVKAGSLNPSGRSYLPKGVFIHEHATSTVKIYFRDEIADEEGKSILFGWVTDDTGLPVPNALVYCQNLDDTPRYLQATKSDEAGVYYFQAVTAGGKYVLVLAVEGDKNAVRLLKSCRVASESRENRMDLIRGSGEIRARVRVSGKPREGALVSLYEVRQPEGATLLASRIANASGEVTFTYVPSSNYLLQSAAEGFCVATTKCIVPEKKGQEFQTYVLDLEPTATLELRFLGSNGEVRTGRTALVVDAEGKPVYQFLRFCNDQGVLRIEGLVPGNYRITVVDRSGRQESIVESTAASGSTTIVPIKVD